MKKILFKYLMWSVFVLCSITGIYVIYPYTVKYDVTVVGRVDPNDSMPSQTINAARLYNKYFKTNAIKIRSGTFADVDNNVKAIFKRSNKLGKFVLFEDTITQFNDVDNVYNKLQERQIISSYKKEEQIWIAYSMFESTKIPDVWVHTINKFFDMVVVPDPYYVDVYKNSGVVKPIFYVPLTLNLDTLLKLPIKDSKNHLFTYMNLSFGRNNKNQLKLLQAFNKVQKIRKDVRLVINSRYVIPETQEDILNYIRSSDIKNIQYTVGKVPREQYIELLQKADCFVYPSRGEGFSIQPRESMAMGVPTIISNNTAQKTICASGLVECVKSDIERAAYYDIWNKVVMGNDFDLKVEDLVDAMIRVYDNYDQYLSKSSEMRDWAKTYTELDDLYINMIKPKKIVLGTNNIITKDYLETNSKEIYEKYKK